MVAVTETKECHPGVKTARCLIDIGTGMNLPVRLINTNNTSVSLVEGTSLCSLDEIESVAEEVEPPEPSVALSHSTPPEPPEPPMASKPPKYINPKIIDSVKRDLIQKLIVAVPPEVSAEHTARLDKQEEEARLVVPSRLRIPLIRLIHDGPTGGHTGITKTKDQVRRRAYWPGWTKTVELFVLSCVPCARYRNRKAPRQGCLHPMINSRPFETLSIDVTGPHPRSSNGYVYILTIVDQFSKFAFAYPMRNQEAATVARILMDQVICLVGTPARILTDQGPNFESALFKELCQAFGIAKIRTSPYKASTNAGAERFHLTLNTMLAKKVKESEGLGYSPPISDGRL